MQPSSIMLNNELFKPCGESRMARSAQLKDGHAVALSLLVAKRRLNSWRVSGTSMLPHVFPGDVCEISPIGTARIGDVAVYILEDCLALCIASSLYETAISAPNIDFAVTTCLLPIRLGCRKNSSLDVSPASSIARTHSSAALCGGSAPRCTPAPASSKMQSCPTPSKSAAYPPNPSPPCAALPPCRIPGQHPFPIQRILRQLQRPSRSEHRSLPRQRLRRI